MGLGDDADRAKDRQQAEDATDAEQRRQNWTAIDGLVREFIPEAARRNTPKARGLFFARRYWLVASSQAERDHLVIWPNGKWELRRDVSGDSVQILGWSSSPDHGPRGPNPIDGLREGVLRLLNS